MSQDEQAPMPQEPSPSRDVAENDLIDTALAAVQGELDNLTELVSSEGENALPIAEATRNEATRPAQGQAEASPATDDAESAAPRERATPPADVLDEDTAAALAADPAAQDDAETSAREEAVPPPASPPAPAERQAGRRQPRAVDNHRDTARDDDALRDRHSARVRAPRPLRRRATRTPSDDVEAAISNLAAFLQDEVCALWSEARQALEDVRDDCDEIVATRARVAALHREMQAMRDELTSARQESRVLQAQLQNLRDEAQRARQRADAAATDAQNSADRAIAAAREAETAATLGTGS